MVTLAVIMPCFNTAPEYIKGAVESVESERTSLTRLNVKLNLFIVDDASESENTRAFLVSIEKQYPWLSVLRMANNSGCSAARNAALQHSDSDWVAFGH